MLQGFNILSYVLILEMVRKICGIHLQKYVYPITYLPKSFYGEIFLI